MSQQKGAQLGPALLCRLMERCESPLVSCIDHCAVPNQEGCDVQVSVRGGVVKWYETAFVLSVDVRAVFQEEFCHLQVVITCRQVERRRVATLRVTAVDVLWGKKLLNPGHVALLGRVQQSGVTSK